MTDWSETFARYPVGSAEEEVLGRITELLRLANGQDNEVGKCLREAEQHRQRAAEYRAKADGYQVLLRKDVPA